MRYIIEWELRNKKKLVGVTDGIELEKVNVKCIAMIRHLVRTGIIVDSGFLIDKDTPYVVKSWEETRLKAVAGPKSYRIIMADSLSHNLAETGTYLGVKSAYNKVMEKHKDEFKTDTAPYTFIYEAKSAMSVARQLIKNREKMGKLLAKADDKRKGVAKDLDVGIFTICSMLKDYITGQYMGIPFITIITIAAAVVYMLNPLDLIPDFKNPVGHLDDIIIVAWVLTAFEHDLTVYKKWKIKMDISYAEKFKMI